MLSKLPSGVKCILFIDACHSATMTREFSTKARSIQLTNARGYISPIKDIVREINVDPGMGDIILISGCKDNETSADAFINGRYNGALTFNFVNILRVAHSLTYSDLINTICQNIKIMGFEQNPQLSCKDTHLTEIFG